MKKQSVLLFLSCIMLAVTTFTSCKKDDPKPAPTVNNDTYDMGTDATATVDVLANDSYTGSAHVSATVGSDYGTVSITSDQKVVFNSKTNFYGTATISYSVQDDNGNSSGKLVIKRGTDAQINTYTLLKTYIPDNFLWLYSVDGDSSRIYQGTASYNSEQISLSNFSYDEVIFHTGGVIIPHMGDYTYTILSDGSFTSYDNNTNAPVVLTNFEAFTDPQAKKRDGSGTMSVSGFSFYYAGKKLIYTTQIQ